MEEFIRSGFERASTNVIVEKANISKGSLFHYFNNKRDIYIFLIEQTIEVIEKIYVEIDYNETDVFERIGQIGWIKFNIQKSYPLVFDFLKAMRKERSEEVRAYIDQKTKDILEDGLRKIYANVDFSKFRKDIDIQKAMDIMNWTMVGFAEKEIEKLNSYMEVDTAMLKEWEAYSKVLKRCFYKAGEE